MGKNDTLQSNTLLASLQIGKLLTSTLNLNEILELIMSKVSELIKAANWSLLLKDENKNELFFAVVVGLDKELIKDVRIPLGIGIAGHVAESGQALFIADAQQDGRLHRKVDQITGFTTKSVICIPLKIQGKTLGVIEIINIEDIEYFKSTYLPILQVLADYAAIAIMNSNYFSKIQRMSVTDEYTGLYNARYLHDILERLISQHSLENKTIAVVFVDIDNFKTVVDTHGHLCGSHILKEIGQTITSYLSKADILIKYGGDEYVIILPDRDKEDACLLVEKIKQAIANSTYLTSESKGIHVTASFGLAMYPQDAQTEKDLLIKADNFMYRVKKGSKNGIGYG
jgi:diguanylate cyclase (GGDEF)-like protein